MRMKGNSALAYCRNISLLNLSYFIICRLANLYPICDFGLEIFCNMLTCIYLLQPWSNGQPVIYFNFNERTDRLTYEGRKAIFSPPFIYTRNIVIFLSNFSHFLNEYCRFRIFIFASLKWFIQPVFLIIVYLNYSKMLYFHLFYFQIFV